MMEIFRDSVPGITKSPSRRVFGVDPATNKIVVPIDLCTYTFDTSGGEVGPDPSLVAFLIGTEVKKSSNGVSIGKIQFAETPSVASNVNPFVILDSSSSTIPIVRLNDILRSIPTIDQIIPTLVSVGNPVTIGGTTVSGKISVLLQELSFPRDASLKIQAFTVQLNTPVGSSFQGSPILTTSGKTVGMLLGSGSTVIACPFP
jgi:hypothetical protein